MHHDDDATATCRIAYKAAFGLGMSALVDPHAFGFPGSVGNYGWCGLATTRFWIDPLEDMAALLMTQFIPSDYYSIEREITLVVYQALVD